MDELELLKKDWQRDALAYPQLSAKEIYPMLLKKSSSIVKLLFYISIAELVFWVLLNSVPFLFDSYRESFDNMTMNKSMFYGITAFTYLIIFVFIYLLYKSYKSISAADTAKGLMESILRTRKVIKYYVLYNLIFGGIFMIISFYYSINGNPEVAKQLELVQAEGKETIFWLATIGMLILALLVFGLFIWLFYRLIYGILLKRLNQNYKELKKLEV